MRSLAFVLLLVSCSPPEPGAVPGLRGMTRDEVVAQLGPPEQSWPVPLDSPTRFQQAAIEALAQHLVGAPGLEVEELRWTDGEFFVAVFVAKRAGTGWTVVDSFRWHREIVIG